MKSRTKPIVNLMHVLCWMIFFGLCVQTGSILYSFLVSLFINYNAAKNLYLGLNLFDVENFSLRHYSAIVSAIITLWALKAFLFYQAIKIFLKINLAHPFSVKVAALIRKMSVVALIIGLLALALRGYVDWLIGKGVQVSNLPQYINGGIDFVFFAGIIFVISLVFRRGIEIQSENELTV
jgi:hypothetical protein